jgi:hypothetical protein
VNEPSVPVSAFGGPVKLPLELIKRFMTEGDQSLEVTLQCWDFAGQVSIRLQLVCVPHTTNDRGPCRRSCITHCTASF